MATAPASTPLRSLPLNIVDGCRVMRMQPDSYRDGSEERIDGIVREARDLGSMSEELALAGLGWPDRYHLSHSRQNVVRALDLSGVASVLDVGAGCGAITRILGERCAVVDALEPELVRARIARNRTRDLGSVEVFVGGMDDVPLQPAYDAVFVVGVLEYCGGGTGADDPYVAFLGRVRDVLLPGGVAVIAIENQLGVKYIAGAPEDHTSHVYEGVEGYRPATHARTFKRKRLSRMVEAAGLLPTVLCAFPDYKFTRCVFGDDLLTEHPELAFRLASYSTGGIGRHNDAVSERLLWRRVIEAGVAEHFPNSFVVLARRDASVQALWPEHRRATMVTLLRRAEFVVQTTVEQRGARLRFERSALAPVARSGPLHHHPRSEDHVPGPELVELLQEVDDGEIERLLRRWRSLVVELGGSQVPPLDPMPSNVIVAGDSLHQIDDEWTHDGYSVTDVLARGALVTATQLAATTHPTRWRERTLRDLTERLGRIVIPDVPQSWIDEAVARESALQAMVILSSEARPDGQTPAAAYAAQIHSWLAMPLVDMPLGARAAERLAALSAEMERQRHEVTQTRTELAAMGASRSWRVTAPLRAMSRQLRDRR